MGWFSCQADFGKASCLKAVETFYSSFFLQEREWVMKEFKEGNLAKKR